MNPFSQASAAARYAQARPEVHPQIIRRIRELLNLDAPVPSALDVACGTGRSARALADVAHHVIASDLSPPMLAQAPPHPRIAYLAASAEALPLANNTFDLLSVALAFHWLRRDRFLPEARRLLRPSGWLVIYNNAFAGQMRENPEFTHWHQDTYLTRFPSPIPHGHSLTDQEAEASGFRFVHREYVAAEVTFTPETLARYLMTQSHVLTAMERHGETETDVFPWLMQELPPLFPAPKATFPFGGDLWLLQRAD